MPHNYSFSEHGGENSTCDSSLLKEPRAIALDFVQQKLYASILNVACKGLLDEAINQTLHEEASNSKPPTILMEQGVEQSILPNTHPITTATNDKTILDAEVIDEVL